jgi:phosphatidylserine/phosphatidylglycerophosphate/cardiolipin synthase-like enzyme
MHNKFAVIDGGLVETGSFNWTTAADTKNHENALFRDDSGLIADYQSYFDWMWRQAAAVGGNPSLPSGTPPACGAGPTALGRAWPECAFSPGGPTEQLIVDAISRAQTRVHIAMFSFSSPPIAQAIIAAKNRGVDVMLVFDRMQARTEPGLKTLQAAGVPYRLNSGIGGSGGVLHDKFGLFDGLLETGSFNYTTNASQNNFENAFFSASPADLSGYEAEFQALYAEGTAN